MRPKKTFNSTRFEYYTLFVLNRLTLIHGLYIKFTKLVDVPRVCQLAAFVV